MIRPHAIRSDAGVRMSCRQLAAAGGEPRKNAILLHIDRTIPHTPRGAALALPLARGVPRSFPDLVADLVIRRFTHASMEAGRRVPAPKRTEQQVLLKIVGIIVALVWLALVIIGVLIKGLVPILVISAAVFGFYLL